MLTISIFCVVPHLEMHKQVSENRCKTQLLRKSLGYRIKRMLIQNIAGICH